MRYNGGPLTPVNRENTTFYLTPGFYKDGVNVLNALNESLQEAVWKNVVFSYDPISNKVTVNWCEEWVDRVECN